MCYKLSSLMMVKAEKWGRKLEKCEAMLTCSRIILCVVSFVFLTFSVLKVVYDEYPCAFSC